ncbi:GNAT family N-acetyltransferase [Anaeromicropila populeti]|uniref:Protein N-acetyltransferase, RimJ/RimL family n=1 Tax=Anaeromicropila populeti TaxID=37658 RepID=A0A1I6KS45_9FIRM|nr:GNAT family N-acetyltransferase [Anaeromicropila populeti]SFR93740.1 Protein N-acetyltransferase, RimJ/RimL family [Anaeromicropila populeti]
MKCLETIYFHLKNTNYDGLMEFLKDLSDSHIKYEFLSSSSEETFFQNKVQSLLFSDTSLGISLALKNQIPAIGVLSSAQNTDFSSAYCLVESFLGLTASFAINEWKHAYMLPVTIAETKRLLIRELDIEDIKDLYSIYSNPEVRRFVTGMEEPLEVEIEKHKAYIKYVYHFYGFGLWGIFDKTGMLIGQCGIQNRLVNGNPEIELSYLVAASHWGKGYAYESILAVLKYSLESLEISSIVAVIQKENQRSIHVANCLGMNLEQELLIDGQYFLLFRIPDLAQYFIIHDEKKRHLAAQTAKQKALKKPVQDVYRKIYS